jgi:hypothetical protein
MTIRNLGIVLVGVLPVIVFGAPPIRGKCANRLLKGDVQQIMAAVSKERDIAHNVRTVDAVSPEKVAIQTGGQTGMGSATFYDFTVSKKLGKWTVDTSSIQTTLDSSPNHRLDSDVIGR